MIGLFFNTHHEYTYTPIPNVTLDNSKQLDVLSTDISDTEEEKTLTAQRKHTLPNLQELFQPSDESTDKGPPEGSFKSLLTSGEEDDEFEQLRQKREQQRQERQKQKLTKNLLNTATRQYTSTSPGSSVDHTQSQESSNLFSTKNSQSSLSSATSK